MWAGTWDVRRFDEIDSTNLYLRDQARRGAPEGTVAVADHQRAGRGRMDRRWEAPSGASLLLSVLFRPEFDPSDLHLCTAAMALAATEACLRVAGVAPVLKWPNDLMVGESKLAGVLAEAEFGGSAGPAVVVGLGLNIDWPGPEGVGGTCLRHLIPGPVDRELLLGELLAALSARRGLLDRAPGRRLVAAELRERCATLGQRVRVELAAGAAGAPAAEPVVGVAVEVDGTGQLVIDTGTGLRTISAGDVVHLRPG